MNKDGFPCPCCGYLTLSEPACGSFEICDVCGWEDDDVQLNNPNFSGGANVESLNEARKNYKDFGAKAKRFINSVRKPSPNEIPPES